MLTCARNGCDVEFEAKTHNQKYCGPECCRIATNKRIMEKYYDKRDRRRGKVRYCKDCEVTRLSRYNDSSVCGPCKEKKMVSINESLATMLSSVAWQA